MLIQRFLNSLPTDISETPVILDVGSYTGEQSCEFAMQFPNARIFAFEARPQSAEQIRKFVAPYSNIEVIESAIHEYDGDTEFHVVNDTNPGASSLFVGSGVQAIHPIQQTSITVSSMRLDTWARRAKISSFDLVWMDLQGAELLALRGMGEMLRTVRAIRRRARRIVFTNGCFDLLHAGHIAVLEEAAKLGDILIVAINSDASVKKLKGPARPIINEQDRARILGALECVDYVLIFDDDTPHHFLQEIRPDVLAKGGTTDVIVGREFVEAYGGKVLSLSAVGDISTTRLIGSIQHVFHVQEK